MKFPYMTLRNINDAAREVGCLSTQEHEKEQALAELRDRRLTEKKEATDHDHECPYCGEYHDNRIACIVYSDRCAEKTAPESYDAEWVTDACPWCLKMRGSPGMVCKDKFGLRCVVEGCGWGDDLTARQAEKKIDKSWA